MKTPEQERLLRDVLNEDEGYAALRAQLRQKMLAEVRRRRWSRRAKPVLALAACVAVALTLLWLVQPRDSNPRQGMGAPTVRSVPLKPEQIVTTAKHNPNVVMVQSRTVEVLSARLDVVRTIGEFRADSLTDEELLDLFKGRAVALVNLSTGKKLVFLDEEAQAGD